jgi:hypothetical protein
MPTRKPPPPDQRPQSDEFIETAISHGTDLDREKFEKLFAKIAKFHPLSAKKNPEQ